MRIKRALIVDNDQVLLTLLANHLRQKGYEIASANDGLSALEKIDSFMPDIVFTDYIMPNINGDKLCRIIRGNPCFDNCFLVMISAAAAEERHALEKDRAADVVLAKHNFDSLSLHIDGILQKLEEGSGGRLKGKTIAAGELYEREITRELLDLQKHHEMTLSNMCEGLVELTRDSRIIYANPSALSIIEIDEENLLSTDFNKLFGNQDRQSIQACIEKAYETGREASLENTLRFKNKSVELKIIPVFSDAGYSVLVILKDVTKQKQLEAQLRHAQKIEALGTLTSGVAHDFNNILNIIMGYTELLEAEIPEKFLPRNNLNQIKEASSRARDIIRQLLLFSRKEKNDEKEPREVGLCIKEALKMIRSTTPALIEIQELIPENLPLVEIDISDIHQIVVNLCKNAVDALEENGGIIKVSVEHVSLSKREACFDANLSEGDYLRLTVSDDGPGICLENQERIFDPYFTTKPKEKGSGLGLSVVLGIVEALKGGVKVKSEPGTETSFEVYLPVSGHVTEKPAVENDNEMPRGNESLLFIDDEDPSVSMNQIRLEKLGYRVEGATDPEKALEMFLAEPDSFDLIVTDITMPKMSGAALCREILKVRPEAKVIACTGYNKKKIKEPCCENGFAEYLEKPVDVQTMAETIRRVLDG